MIASRFGAMTQARRGARRGFILRGRRECQRAISRAGRSSSPEQAAASATPPSSVFLPRAGALSPARGTRSRRIVPGRRDPEDHIQVDLAEPENTDEAIAEIKRRLNGELHALVNNAAISPKADGGKRLGSIGTSRERLAPRFPGQFLCSDHAGARAPRRAQGRQGLGRQCHLDRGLARAPVRRRGLCDVEGSARSTNARDGARLRRALAFASTPSRRARSTPRCCRPVRKRSSR